MPFPQHLEKVMEYIAQEYAQDSKADPGQIQAGYCLETIKSFNTHLVSLWYEVERSAGSLPMTEDGVFRPLKLYPPVLRPLAGNLGELLGCSGGIFPQLIYSGVIRDNHPDDGVIGLNELDLLNPHGVRDPGLGAVETVPAAALLWENWAVTEHDPGKAFNSALDVPGGVLFHELGNGEDVLFHIESFGRGWIWEVIPGSIAVGSCFSGAGFFPRMKVVTKYFAYAGDMRLLLICADFPSLARTSEIRRHGDF